MFVTKPRNEDVYNHAIVDGFSKVEAHTLATRLTNPDKIKDITESIDVPNLSNFLDMDKGAERLIKAIKGKEHITLVTDYDADGVDSAAIGYRGLLLLGVKEENITVFINERKYGNGVNQTMIDRILMAHAKKPVGLTITADHGSADEIRYKQLKQNNIDVIVTDHHETKVDPMKYVIAFINPKRKKSNFTPYISGATVLYFLLTHTRDIMKLDVSLDTLLPFIALTIISDQMNLTDPLNRRLFKDGIRLMNQSDSPPWSTIRKVNKTKQQIDETTIGFGIAPIINSGNRMGRAIDAYHFLVTHDPVLSTEAILQLNTLNKARKKKVIELRKEGDRQFRNYKKIFDNTMVIVLHKGDGINGILAGTYSEMSRRPTGVFVKGDDGTYTGSFRGIGDIDLLYIFQLIEKENKDIFIRYGGHAQAAGVTLHQTMIKPFMHLFDKYVKEVGYKELPYMVDIYLTGEISLHGLYESTHKLSPFGNNWEKPIYAILGTVTKISLFGFNNSYGTVTVNLDGQILEFFCMRTTLLKDIKKDDRVSVSFSVSLTTKKDAVVPSLLLDNIIKEK